MKDVRGGRVRGPTDQQDLWEDTHVVGDGSDENLEPRVPSVTILSPTVNDTRDPLVSYLDEAKDEIRIVGASRTVDELFGVSNGFAKSWSCFNSQTRLLRDLIPCRDTYEPTPHRRDRDHGSTDIVGRGTILLVFIQVFNDLRRTSTSMGVTSC